MRSISRIAASNTFAPLLQSCQRVSSRGEWLIPPTLGTKIIPIGPSCAIIWASCPAPLGSRTDASPRVDEARSIARWTPASASAGGFPPRLVTSIVVFDVRAISAARALTSSASDASTSGDRSRSSIVNSTFPGITFGAFGSTMR
jgi:hypothetical protein